jgi:hypothetical protein
MHGPALLDPPLPTGGLFFLGPRRKPLATHAVSSATGACPHRKRYRLQVEVRGANSVVGVFADLDEHFAAGDSCPLHIFRDSRRRYANRPCQFRLGNISIE